MRNQVAAKPVLPFFVRSEGLYKTYLTLYDQVASLLLSDTSRASLVEAFHQIGVAAGAAICALYLNEDRSELAQFARFHCGWHTPEIPFHRRDLVRLRHLSFDAYPELADHLRAGMLLRHPVEMLTQDSDRLMRYGLSEFLAIPVILHGEVAGCLVLLRRPGPHWGKEEVQLLCTVVNDLALALDRDQAAEALAANQHRLQALVGATEDVVIECDHYGSIINLWSHLPRFAHLDAIGLPLVDLLPVGLASPIAAALAPVLQQRGSQVLRCLDNTEHPPHHYNVRVQAVTDIATGRTSAIALIRDITSLVHEEQRWQTMLRTVNLLDETIIELSVDGKLRHASSAWARLRAIPHEQIALDYGVPLSRWVHPEDLPDIIACLSKLSSGHSTQSEVRFRWTRGDGSLLWMEARLIAQHPHALAQMEIHGVLRDITIAHQQEHRIIQMALYDALTELPNRVLLDNKLHDALQRARRNDTKVALAFIDLDHFKLINDTLGHKAGDEVLINLSRRLKATLREVDTLARWGGDEFVALLPDITSNDEIAAVAERLREIARQGIMLEGLEARPSISIGIALFPDDADNGESLLSLADHTLFYAKSAGRNNVQFYSDISTGEVLNRQHVALQGWLAEAIQNKHIQVFYQPVVDVHDGTIASFEALARWHHDEEGWISPNVFIPIAEKIGLIRELSDIVLNDVLRRLVGWRALGYRQSVAVNISRQQLCTNGFSEQLSEQVRAHGLVPADLVLEITESTAVADVARQTRFLEQLVEAGFVIAIDDFGTGYSALSQLHDMPVTTLKIDSSFVARVTTDRGQRVVQAIVQMAHALGLSVIAEGVENAEIVDALTLLGVRRMQGFWYSEAVPAGLCEALLNEGTNPLWL